MKENIFEIISELVKRLLYDEEEVENSKKLINSLKEDGYNIDEINQAFEFIFASENSEDGEVKKNRIELITNDRFKQRVFNIKERISFDLEIQGALIQLSILDLIKEEELEELITKLLIRYRGSAKITDLWQTVEEVIDDDLKLLSISNKIPQFTDLNQAEVIHLH
ncbi:MAG: DUF494 family protein [Bacillota bacterium]